MIQFAALAPLAEFAAYLAAAVLAAGAALWIARVGDASRPDRTPLALAAALIAVWCALSASLGPDHPAARLALTGRNLALIAVIYRLLATDGRAASLRPIRPVIGVLVLVQLFQPALLLIEADAGSIPMIAQLTFETWTLTSMMVAIGALMLLHNLYAGASAAARQILRWPGIALTVIFAYDLNLHTTAYLGGGELEVLTGQRGLIAGAMAALFALGTNIGSAGLQFSPSRVVAFRSLSLLLIGSYLAMMVLVAKALALIGGDIARASQIVFLVLAILAAIIWLPSPRLRGWMRVTATKHLFQHRYDYREEWLRFTRTIGRGTINNASLQERAVQALADITESPAGLLLMPDGEGRLELTARWNWATIEVPAVAAAPELASLVEQNNLVLALDEVRAGVDHHGEIVCVPQWLAEADDAWALVPLIHFDRLIAAVVLARPRVVRQLDWEDFDLLRVAGQQLASYLSEQAGQQALMDASRFDEFNRRMAFVMHDIKNLASQLSLLCANAERHADNPAFRADMLITLRNSSDKLSALLARLGRYGSGQVQDLAPVDLAHMAMRVAERFRAVHPVALTRVEPVEVMANTEALEQALIHLVQNAIDASEPGMPVYLDVYPAGLRGEIEVIDSGCGMTPEFMRTGLFKPFVSSKPGGFGIGAFEARELVKAMGGRVVVESREGIGTRFGVSLPIAETLRLFGGEHPPAAHQREIVR